MSLTSLFRLGRKKAVEELQRDEGSLSVKSSEKAPREQCGLFTFAAPSEGEDYTADIVAVHGLGGDWEKTWTDPNGKLWLRDFLPFQIPPARIMSYGYNSNTIFTSAVTDITDEAAMLLNRLDQERDSKEQKTKPIIFVAHSLGGIVVKKALIIAHERSKHYAGLLACVKGCLFLGVPHRGADSAYWGKFAADLLSIPQLGFGGNTNFLNALKSNSPTLADISQQFIERSSLLEIRTFWEIEKVGNLRIVSKDSACLNIDNEIAVGSNANHINLCKFADAASQRYSPVWRALKGLIDSAVPVKASSPVYPVPVSLSQEEIECLQHLYTSNYRSFINRTPEWEPGTCRWFLEHRRYRDWRQEKISSLLWVSADPGCGKSVLARFLVHELQREESQSILPGTVCHFFFKDDNERQKSASSALCALLHQFFESKPATIRYAVHEYALKGKKLIDELETLWEILVAASTAPESGNIICVIDGLDECEEAARAQLMDLLIRFYKRRPTSHSNQALLKMIITSRPYSLIERKFHILPTIRLRVEDETEALSADIEVVVNGSIGRLGALWDLPSRVRDRLRDKLLRNADRTFLWVSLILDMLISTPKPSESEFDGILGSLPPDLDATFEKILLQSSNSNDARRILQLVIAATRPLTLEEMNVALAIRPGHRSMEDLRPHLVFDPKATLKALCGLFLRIIDSKVYLVHQSAKEFLAKDPTYSNGHSGVWKHSLPSSESNCVIAEVCVLYLSFDIFESNPLVLGRSSSLKNPARANQYVAAHCFLDYAADNWVFHFRAAGNCVESPLIKLTRDLCVPSSQRFRTWISVYGGCEHISRKNYTELMVASHFGLKVLMTMLLESGANVHAVDLYGWTALHEAALRGFEGTELMLLAAGANVHAVDSFGSTALYVAALHGHEGAVSILLAAGANVHAVDSFGSTALYVAASHGHEGAVSSILLAAGANVDAVDSFGSTALYVAASHGHKGTVSILLAAGANVHAVDSYGDTALHMATSRGFESTVSMLLAAGANVHAVGSSGRTALHQATSCGFEGTMSMLLAAGANVHAVEIFGYTALHEAASHGHEGTVSILLAAGAKVHSASSRGKTALHNAALHGHEGAVSILLAAGANVNSADLLGETALHEAAREGCVSMVRLLLQHGACINARDNRGLMPSHLAAEGRNMNVFNLLLTEGADFDLEGTAGGRTLPNAASCGLENVVQQLLRDGVDINGYNEEKRTALHEAVLSKNEKMVKLLLDNEIFINTEDMDGQTALHEAVLSQNEKMVKLLLDSGIFINAEDMNRRTALYGAMSESMIRLLLQHGANVFIPDEWGKTPLQVTERYGPKSVARLPKSHIAGLDGGQRTNLEMDAYIRSEPIRFEYIRARSDSLECLRDSDPESESEQSAAS